MSAKDQNKEQTKNFPTIEGLELISLIGEGAFSKVFLAKQSFLERAVAVKILHSTDNKTTTQRFQNEAKILSSLQHPNITQIISYGFSELNNCFYIVMEYCAGETLESYIQKKFIFSKHQLNSIILQITEALKYAHSQSIIHRDLKPANILLTKAESNEFIVKLLDFGIAKILEQETLVKSNLAQNLTQTGKIVGSPRYMSPEQCLGNKIDKSSDIYSLASILFELIFLKPVFEAESDYELAYKKSHNEPIIPSNTNTNFTYNKELMELIRSSLSKNPVNRPQSMGEFLAKFIFAMGELNLPNTQNKQKAFGSLDSTFSTKAFTIISTLLCILVFSFFYIANQNSRLNHNKFSNTNKAIKSKKFISGTHGLAEAIKFFSQGQIVESSEILQIAKLKNSDPLTASEISYYLSMSQNLLDQNEVSRKTMLEAIKEAHKNNLAPQDTALLYTGLAKITPLNKFQEKEDALSKAIKLYQVGKSSSAAKTLAGLAELQFECDEKIKSKDTWSKLEEILKDEKVEFSENSARLNVGLLALSNLSSKEQINIITNCVKKIIAYDAENNSRISTLLGDTIYPNKVNTLIIYANYLSEKCLDPEQALKVALKAKEYLNIEQENIKLTAYFQTKVYICIAKIAARKNDLSLFKSCLKQLFCLNPNIIRQSIEILSLASEINKINPKFAALAMELGLSKLEAQGITNSLFVEQTRFELAKIYRNKGLNEKAKDLFQTIVSTCDNDNLRGLKLYKVSTEILNDEK